MINHIIIDNFATIEHLEFDLGESLNIITGETGSGKSVLVTAISTALGSRADKNMVRTGAEKALIQILATASNNSNDDTDNSEEKEIIISREIHANGKSISKINGEIVTLSAIKDFCSKLVDIHGQYDNQQILNSDNHIFITDSYKHELISKPLDELSSLYKEYSNVKSSLNRLISDEKSSQSQRDFWEFESNYINSLDLKSGEDDMLSDAIKLMKNGEKIYNSIDTAYEMLYNRDDAVVSQLDRIVNELNSVSEYNDDVSSISDEISDIYYQLEDITNSLEKIHSSLSFSDDDIDAYSERLAKIEDAKRKYHRGIDDILAYKDELQTKLSSIENFEYDKNRLTEELNQKKTLLDEKALHVSEIRRLIAGKLQDSITSELENLDFANAKFKIQIDKNDEITPLGMDNVEFMISTNPGSPLMPLSSIASGGEISRIMLAFKHIIGENDNVETMIFDEIDTGISGRTALVVGKKLHEISKHHQVICITHLPQIAAYGDSNYLISKDISDNEAKTEITRLDYNSKIAMIANLFSGSSVDESALNAAAELVEKVSN